MPVQVTLTLPPLLKGDAMADAIRTAVVRGLDAEMPEIAGEIATSASLPRDRGGLQRAVAKSATPARIVGSKIEAALVLVGPVAQYGDVMNLGRRPGKRAPPLAAIRGWVKRKMKAAVNEIASNLQAEYALAHPRGRQGVSRSIKKYREQAQWLLARSIQRKIATEGTVGRHFIPEDLSEIASRLEETIVREFRIAAREQGGSA